MAGRLNDKVAIITGAGQGIGEATARAFAAEGASVVIAEFNEQTGTAVAASLSHKVIALNSSRPMCQSPSNAVRWLMTLSKFLVVLMCW